MIKVHDFYGHTIDIPEEEYKKMQARCLKCHACKLYEKLFKIRIDFCDCPYECDNHIDQYRKLHKERVRYE